jgi:hypothetical protein
VGREYFKIKDVKYQEINLEGTEQKVTLKCAVLNPHTSNINREAKFKYWQINKISVTVI